MKNLIQLYLFLFPVLPCIAQQPQLLQERNYNISSLERELVISTPDKQGNIFYSGSSLNTSGKLGNYFLLINQNTDTIWTKRGLGEFLLKSQDIQKTSDGGFIFGSIVKGSNNLGAMHLQKQSANGINEWVKVYNGAPGGITNILSLPDKGYFLAGGYGQGKGFTFIRTDSLGNIKLSKDYTRSLRDDLLSMEYTKEGKIIAAGLTGGNFQNSWHPKLLLVNQNGDSLRGKTLVLTGFNRREGMYYNFNSVTPLSDGGFLLTANTDTVNATYPNGSYMGMVVKVDSTFNVQWKYVHRNQQVDEYAFTKAKELTDGSILVLGFQFRPTQGGNGFQLYRFGLNGQLINVYPFTSSICSQTWGITLDYLAADSTYLVGGRCGNNPPITYGYYVAKVKVPGLPLPVAPFTVTSTKPEVAAFGAGLGQSYPNPTAASAIIPYTLPQHYTKASILIREIATGREIKRYELKRNSNSLNVDLSHLSNGLYLYSLVVDEQPVATKKLAVMK